jgi:hypothetical protein
VDPYVRDSLSALGITPENHRVLMLLPLVYVAWADGKMEDVEIEKIDEIAKARFYFNKSAIDILDGWLKERPTQAYFDEGLQDLFLLAQTEDGDPLVHPEELYDLLAHATAIARASGRALDARSNVVPEEEGALTEISKALGIDNGLSWRKLLDELDAGPASIRRGRMPHSRRFGST